MLKEIILNTHKVVYELRRNKQSKRIRLTVSDRGLVVSVPQEAAMRYIERVLIEKQEWIMRRLTEAAARIPVKKTGFATGDSLLYLGDPVRLIVQEGGVSRYAVHFAQGVLTLRTPGLLQPDERWAGIAKTLTAWYTDQAREFIMLRIDFWAGKMQLAYNRVSIKALNSRWGSCSRLRNLNFNFRLIMAPAPIIDYVIIHELCHLTELNHSPLFWREVERFCPDYKQKKQWLRDNGFKLFIL